MGNVTTPSGEYEYKELQEIENNLKQAYKDYWSDKITGEELTKILNDSKLSAGELDSIKYDASREEDNKVEEGKKITEGVDWGYYNKFKDINNKYLPDSGEGETLATQTVTAVNKLIYKWYNDGDTYDTTTMQGWANDLSSYANWLAQNIDGAKDILDEIYNLSYNDENGYEKILKKLADSLFDEEYLEKLNEQPKDGSIYECDGDYVFEEYSEDEEEDYYDEDEDDGWSDYDEDRYDPDEDPDWTDEDELEESFGIKSYSEKLNEAKESDKEIFDKIKNEKEDKSILDLIQDRIGQDISVGELNTMLQSIFGKYNEVFLLSNMLYNADTDEPQELVIDDDDDMYTITFKIKDLEEAIIEITDVVVE